MKNHIAIVGLGYVGLPLASKLASNNSIIGYDINEDRIKELRNGHDYTNEVKDIPPDIRFTCTPCDLSHADVLIITVPTPVKENKQPDLTALNSAVGTVMRNMKPKATMIIESTVYPGYTDEIAELMEKETGKKLWKDFFVGYSPERINPGDEYHRFQNTTKIIASPNEDTLKLMAELYSPITNIHPVRSFQEAEAAKCFENIQRDVNIATVNEFVKILDQMEIDSNNVLEACRTKWNFLDFRPGLVGGHCIPVDPYYFMDKAKEYEPFTIMSHARSVNENMLYFIANKIRAMTLKGSQILVCGKTYKANVPDTRNSLTGRLCERLKFYGRKVKLVDPLIDSDFDMKCLWEPDYTVIAVAHDEILNDKVLIPRTHTEYIDLTGKWNKTPVIWRF